MALLHLIITSSNLFTDQVHLLRYEDLCLKTNETADAMLDFLDMPRHALIEKFISTNTNDALKNEKGWKARFSTERDSKSMAYEWKNHLKDKEISEVQLFCEKPMKMLGYNLMKDISINILDDDYPLLLHPPLKITR